MSESEWVEKVQLVGADGTPLRISGLAEASVLRRLLTANGIDSEVSEPSTAFHQFPAHLILVSADQVDEAARIIAEARPSGPTVADEAERAGEAAGDLTPDGL